VFWLLVWFMLVPAVVPASFGAIMNEWDAYPFLAAVLGLSFNNTPYVADILYSAIATVDRDVVASARMAGIRGLHFWLSVMLPGAIVSTVPALSARFIHNLKNTSLAMVISVHDLTWTAQEIESLTFAGVEATTVCTLIYAAMAAGFSAILALAGRRARLRYRLPG
jgi:polar amino acid transport system permease protein